LTYAGVQVWTDYPWQACMASQYAGWAVQVGKYFAMASGPLRAHARVEKELFDKLGDAEQAEHAVLVLEGRTLPTDDVARWIAGKSGLDPSRLTFAIAPTASLYGGVPRFTIQADDPELEDLATRLPASSSGDYGTPFYEIFQRYNGDFYRIDKMLFSPAEVWLTST